MRHFSAGEPAVDFLTTRGMHDDEPDELVKDLEHHYRKPLRGLMSPKIDRTAYAAHMQTAAALT